MKDSTYEKVVADVAADLNLDETTLRQAFSVWINRSAAFRAEEQQSKMDIACYAVYRLTKLTSACHMTQRSRDRWRDRAISLGSPPHLVETK